MRFYQFNEEEKRVDIFNERFYPIKVGKEIEWYRNVTTILGIIDKGYAFQEWLKNVGHNSEIIVDRAGRFGSDFHKIVELFLNDNKISYYDIIGDDRYKTDLWERFNLWVGFYKEAPFNPVMTETVVHSKTYKYAGTADCVTTATLYDWKTGNIVGNSEKLQMVAYMKALQEMGHHVQRAVIVHIPAAKPNKKGYKLIEVPYSDELFDLFLSTKKVFDMENNDKPKILTLPLELNKKEL